MSEMRLLIAGGGTGGHLYPGIAIAEEVMSRPGGEVLFVGTARGLETKLVPAAGFRLELLDVSGLNRVGFRALLKGLLRLPRAFFQSRAVLNRFRPDLVIGVGGYASGPMVFTAALLGYPTAIQEQNSHPGFTNRILGRLVKRVFVAFEHAQSFFALSKLSLVGNPVRRRFLSALVANGPGDNASIAAHADHAADGLSDRVLVVGGSQGARAVNDMVLGAVAQLQAAGRLPRIIHQTGPFDEARVKQRYAELGVSPEAIEVRAFIDDMPSVVKSAGLVIGRAGALTLAELAIVGRPAILIPLPTAADDHQTRNAAEFANAGAAVVLDQRATNPNELARMVIDLLSDKSRRTRMAEAMARLGKPNAAREIVDNLAGMSASAKGNN